MYEERAGNSGVWQQVQRKINGEINDAISNGWTTLKTYRSLHRGARRLLSVDVENKTMQDTDVENKAMQDTGGDPIRLSVAQLRDARNCFDVGAPIWQFAENWGWQSYPAHQQATLEGAYQRWHTTGQGETHVLSHEWTQQSGRKRKKVLDWYSVNLRLFTSTAMQHRHTVRLIRRVERVPGAQVSFGDTIADGTDRAIPAAGGTDDVHDGGSQPDQTLGPWQ